MYKDFFSAFIIIIFCIPVGPKSLQQINTVFGPVDF